MITSVEHAPRTCGRGLWTRMLIAAAALVAGLAAASPAHAQFGQATGITEIMQPEFLSRDVTVFAEQLDLDASQSLILESLYDSYRQDFEEGLEQLRGSFENIKDQINPDDPQQAVALVFAPFESWRDDRNALREQFLARVQAILTPAQRNNWADFLLHLRRLKELPKGTLSGEKLDLFLVMRDLNLPRQIARNVQPSMDAYALELDAALRNRESTMAKSQQSMIQMIQAQDTEKSLGVIRDQFQARMRVRDVNLNSIDVVAEALPEDLKPAFRERALTGAYPRVYRRTSNEEMIEEAHTITGLSDDQQNSIQALQQEFFSIREALRQRLTASIREHEPAAEINRAEMYIARSQNERVARIADPSVEIFRERETMGNTYVERLRGLLSEDQFSELPGGESYLGRMQRAEQAELDAQAAESDNKSGEFTGEEDDKRRMVAPDRGGLPPR